MTPLGWLGNGEFTSHPFLVSVDVRDVRAAMHAPDACVYLNWPWLPPQAPKLYNRTMLRILLPRATPLDKPKLTSYGPDIGIRIILSVSIIIGASVNQPSLVESMAVLSGYEL